MKGKHPTKHTGKPAVSGAKAFEEKIDKLITNIKSFVPPGIMHDLIKSESNFNPNSISKGAKAKGLVQTVDSTTIASAYNKRNQLPAYARAIINANVEQVDLTELAHKKEIREAKAAGKEPPPPLPRNMPRNIVTRIKEGGSKEQYEKRKKAVTDLALNPEIGLILGHDNLKMSLMVTRDKLEKTTGNDYSEMSGTHAKIVNVFGLGDAPKVIAACDDPAQANNIAADLFKLDPKSIKQIPGKPAEKYSKVVENNPGLFWRIQKNEKHNIVKDANGEQVRIYYTIAEFQAHIKTMMRDEKFTVPDLPVPKWKQKLLAEKQTGENPPAQKKSSSKNTDEFKASAAASYAPAIEAQTRAAAAKNKIPDDPGFMPRLEKLAGFKNNSESIINRNPPKQSPEAAPASIDKIVTNPDGSKSLMLKPATPGN